MAAVVRFPDRQARSRVPGVAAAEHPSGAVGAGGAAAREAAPQLVAGRRAQRAAPAEHHRPEYHRPEYRRPARRGMGGAGRGVRPSHRPDVPPLAVTGGVVAGGVGVAATRCAARSRARSVRALALLGLLSALAAAALVVVYAASTPELPQRTAVVQVHEGQTLSEIAAASAPNADRSSMLRHIRGVNHLQSGALRTGQTLVVPVSG